MDREKLRKFWLFGLLVCALGGVLIKFGVFGGGPNWHQVRYFTNLSNLLGAAYALWVLLRPRDDLRPLRGMAVLALTVTAVVYHGVLTSVFGGYVPFTLGWWGNLLVHTVTPALMVGEWLLFRAEQPLRWYHPLIWALFPVAYFAMTVAIAKTGTCMPGSATPYPYTFLDVWSLGWGTVLRNVAGLAAAFLGLGYALVGLDGLRGRNTFPWNKLRSFVWVIAVTIGCLGLSSCQRQAAAQPEPTGADDIITLHTVDGRAVTVELDLEPTARGEDYCAVTQLRVVENGELLHSIDPSELVATYGMEGLYVLNGYKKIGRPDVRDFNFDGSDDLALLAESMLPKNPAYLYFLWNGETDRLEDSFVLTALPDLDAEAEQIVEKMANGFYRYYVWQDGVLCEIPACVQTMELLEAIGKPFDQITAAAGMEYQSVAIPNASGQCIGDSRGGARYFFFGAQDVPGLADLSAEYSRQLRCAGIVSTVGGVYPQMAEAEIDDGVSLDSFCFSLWIEDYTYGFEDAPDQGWLCFSWEGYTVWIDTDNPVTELHDPAYVGVDFDDVILIVDEEIANENALIRDGYWNDDLDAGSRA